MKARRPHSLALVFASAVPALTVVWTVDPLTPALIGIAVVAALVSVIPKPRIPWRRISIITVTAAFMSVTSFLYARESGTVYAEWGLVTISDGSFAVALANGDLGGFVGGDEREVLRQNDEAGAGRRGLADQAVGLDDARALGRTMCDLGREAGREVRAVDGVSFTFFEARDVVRQLAAGLGLELDGLEFLLNVCHHPPLGPFRHIRLIANRGGRHPKVWALGGGHRAWPKLHATAKLGPGVITDKVSVFLRIGWIVAAIRR